MKTFKIATAALVALMSVACSSGNAGKGGVSGADSLNVTVPALPSKATVDSVSYLVGIQFGSFIKGYNFGDLNFNQIKKGIDDFVKAKGNPRDTAFAKQFKINPELMGELFNSYLAERQAYVAASNAQKEAKFFADNAKKEGVQTTESGLQYIINEAGSEQKIGAQDTLFVHYKGTLTDGTVFDQVEESAPSARMLLNRVIPGWTEGLQLVGEGGSIRLFVPSNLGYGEQGQPQAGIEGNSPIIFDVKVDSVKRYVAPVDIKK